MCSRCMVLVLVLGTCLARPAQTHSVAQDKTPLPTLKTGARLVLVDVIVTDGNGEPV